jgi:AcrR family transcriptional regulator
LVIVDRPTVDWTASDPTLVSGGLRERKKRLMRQQLSDVATQLFMERGFDAVRVAEIAAACGVSEKTVFNYFPTKESLVLDRLSITVASLRAGSGGSADRAARRRPAHPRRGTGSHDGWLAQQSDPTRAGQEVRRFGDLIEATPSLRAYQSDMKDQFVTAATEALATRTGRSVDDPEPQIAASALLGLWHVQEQSLRRHLAESLTPNELHRAVIDDVHRAAQLIGTGLHSFAPTPKQRRSGRVRQATK